MSDPTSTLTPLATILKQQGCSVAPVLSIFEHAYQITSTLSLGMFFKDYQDIHDRLISYLPMEHQNNARLVSGINMTWFTAQEASTRRPR